MSVNESVGTSINSVPATGISTWPVEGKDFGGYLAEAFVADYLAATDSRTRWAGGNRKGADVYSHFPDGITETSIIKARGATLHEARVKVDAKRTTIKRTNLDGESTEVVSFLAKTYTTAGGGLCFARADYVSHFGLVVLEPEDRSNRASEVSIDAGVATMTVTYRLERLYLVPADAINDPDVFRRKQNQSTGAEYGMELVASTAAVEPYLVQARTGVIHTDYRIPN